MIFWIFKVGKLRTSIIGTCLKCERISSLVFNVFLSVKLWVYCVRPEIRPGILWLPRTSKRRKNIGHGTVLSTPFSAEMQADASSPLFYVHFKVSVILYFGHVAYISHLMRQSKSQQLSVTKFIFFNSSSHILCSNIRWMQKFLFFYWKY